MAADFEFRSDALSPGVRAYQFPALTVGDALDRWAGDATFRADFARCLADAPLTAFRWETPALTRAALTRPFAFVLVDAPELASRPVDRHAFDEHFTDAPVSVFTNLGGDATMIAPAPQADDPRVYGHLAAFVRGAPATQVDALWRTVGVAAKAHVGERPVWLSTAGAGVAWLHVRLDRWPKYYHHAPYRRSEPL